MIFHSLMAAHGGRLVKLVLKTLVTIIAVLQGDILTEFNGGMNQVPVKRY